LLDKNTGAVVENMNL